MHKLLKALEWACFGAAMLLPFAAQAQQGDRPVVVRRPPGKTALPSATGVPAPVQPAPQPIVVRRVPSQPEDATPSTPAAMPAVAVAPAVSPDAPAGQSPIVVRRTEGVLPATVPAVATPLESTLLAGSAIQSLLQQQSEDWNRGDLQAFATGYKRSPDILFLGGGAPRRGYDSMLQRYRESYPTRERMGTLSFTQLEVQPLSPDFATATGTFHLDRSAAGGGPASGSFLLVLERTTEGWKIVRDDTTSAPPAKR